jgi:hypothetical protein
LDKEFVLYQEALALKELGFDEPCFFAFDNCSTPMRCSDLRTNEQKFNGVNYNSSSYTSQPTFSQAFRWFREKYEYNTEIVWMTAVNFKYSARIKSKLGTDYINEHETYEEAELACLRKLIEIVQGGNK